jgi:phage shock protein PspC (stress-responsive transcriptional regulator)
VTDRLYRSRTDRVIAGVAGGLAAWLRIDPSIVRVGWVVLAVLSGGIFLLVYIVMMIVVPLAPEGWMPSAGPPPGGAWGAPPNTTQWGSAPPTGQWTAGQPGSPPGAPGAAGMPGGQPGSPPPGQWTPPPGGPGPSWRGPDTTNAGIVGGFVLVGLGAWFLVDQYVHIDWQLVWPVVVILIGAGLIVAAMRRSRPSG